MGFDPLSLGLAALSGAGALSGHSASQKAAKAQEQAGEYQADLLEQQAANDLDARIENSRRLADNHERELARLRVIQANSGTTVGEGTAALIFDDVRSRLDERLDDFVKGQSAQIDRTRNNAQQALWQSKTNASSTRLAARGRLISGVAHAGTMAYQAFDSQASPSGEPRPYSLF